VAARSAAAPRRSWPAPDGDQGAGQGHRLAGRAGGGPAEQLGDRGGAVLGPQDQDPDQQQHGRDAGDEQRHQGRQPRLAVLAVEADEQVGRDRGEVPEQEQEQQVLGGGQADHGHKEQRHEGVEPPPVGLGALLVLQVAGHIGGGVGEDGDADPGGQQGVQGTEAVEPEGQPGVPGWQPGDVEPAAPGEPRSQHRDERDHREGDGGDAGSDRRCDLHTVPPGPGERRRVPAGVRVQHTGGPGARVTVPTGQASIAASATPSPMAAEVAVIWRARRRSSSWAWVRGTGCSWPRASKL